MAPRLGLRPGTTGRPIVARTNAFTMSWTRPAGNKGYVYHYDGTLYPIVHPTTIAIAKECTSRSVRPTLGKIIVNVDTTIGVILPVNNLDNICAEYLHLRNIRELGKQHVPQLRLFLRGVKVDITLPGHSSKRSKTIKDVIFNVGEEKFEKDGEKISVVEHFARAHQYTIRGGSLGVKLGNDGLFPTSVCKTVQQIYKVKTSCSAVREANESPQNRSSPDVVREALEFSPRDPRERLGAIGAGWQQLQYTESIFLSGAGITVDPQPLVINGRILPSPTIGFGNSEKLSPQRQGVWDIMRRKFVEPARLEGYWTIVDFANADPVVLNTFVSDLRQCMSERGMNVDHPHDFVRGTPNPNTIPAVLREAGRNAKALMILVILPESAPQPYREVKRFGDITQGVVTQCVKWSRKLANDAQNRKANQYYNNLLLKINAKLGGVNYIPMGNAMAFLSKSATMIIGADVSHPAPGSSFPSISSLVASVDSRFSRYTASIRLQARRTEVIEKFSEMFKIALQKFHKRNQTLPVRIFVFRDGVSEGEFQIIIDKEVASMRGVLEEEYGKDTQRWPELNFIIVGKRHHFRFFADRDGQDPKGNGNLYSGFVVDRGSDEQKHLDYFRNHFSDINKRFTDSMYFV
ncbi:hypothetical protein H0H92_012275 [Tricholoma furcatifolium]|nr:hypothetical protein H0H92_012275 [Tricholoma furcatifolium]